MKELLISIKYRGKEIVGIKAEMQEDGTMKIHYSAIYRMLNVLRNNIKELDYEIHDILF